MVFYRYNISVYKAALNVCYVFPREHEKEVRKSFIYTVIFTKQEYFRAITCHLLPTVRTLPGRFLYCRFVSSFHRCHDRVPRTTPKCNMTLKNLQKVCFQQLAIEYAITKKMTN